LTSRIWRTRRLQRPLQADKQHLVRVRRVHSDEARRRRDRVLGCHMLGPDAPEIIQRAAITIKCGAARRQLDQAVGIYAERRRGIRYYAGTRPHAGEGCSGVQMVRKNENLAIRRSRSHICGSLDYGAHHMPDILAASQYEFPLAALIDATEWTESASGWAKLRSAQERALKALEGRRKELDDLYQRAIAPDSEWQEIAQVASIVGEWGCAAAEKLRPQIDALQQKLATPTGRMSRELRQARRESIEVAEAWLTLYRELQGALLKLAAERRPANAVLRARPLEDEIDYAGLSREHMARYPKIRAALAK
jgi:hypothetical protein